MNRIFTLFSVVLLSFISFAAVSQNTVTVTVWLDDNGDGNIGGLESPFDIITSDGADLLLWQDTDGDGVQEGAPDDTQMAVVQNNNDGTFEWPAAAALTDGDYYIEYVPAGGTAYFITEFNVGAPSATDSDIDPATNYSTVFNLTDPSDEVDVDLGVFTACTIETRVWSEANYDGGQDDANDVTAGTITLYESDGVTLATDLTGTSPVPLNGGPGNYTFDNLAPGDYIIEYDTPTTPGGSVGPYFSTISNIDADENDMSESDMDSDIPQMVGPHVSRLLSVTSGNTNSLVDAGFFLPGVVETTIWHDINGDGLQDEAAGNGITGIADGTFTLINDDIGAAAVDAYGDPVLWVELADGTYQWQNLIPGNYHIEYSQTIMSGGDTYYATKYMEGGDPTADSDANPAMSWESTQFVVSADQVATDFDAGFFVPATVTTFVWDDANGNGEQDGAGPPAEDGITGEGANFQLWDNVTMLQAIDVMGNPIVSNEMGAPGEYVFELVPPGDYFIQYVLPAPSVMGNNYVPTQMDQGPDDNDSDVDPIMGNPTYLQSPVFTLISEDEEEEVDAGFLLPAQITCYVWEDMNGNGIQDEAAGNEILGAEAVPVATLFENDGVTLANDIFGVPAVLTAGLNPGEYDFLNLAPGEYIVQFTVPPSPVATPYSITRYNNDGMMGTDANDTDTDSDADPNNMLQSYIIELGSEEIHERVDAGFYVPGIVGDRVFCDKNADGIFDAIDLNEGVPGVTVTMFSTDPLVNEDPLLDINGMALTMMTDALGNYQFVDVPPGVAHQIRFEGLANFEVTLVDQGGDDDIDSDAIPDILNPENGITDPFELLSREDLEESERMDCGMYQLIRVQGTVWIDADMDGMFSTEPGVSGVNIELLEVGSGNPPDMTISGAGGDYVFLDVKPGSYIITITKDNTEPGGVLEGAESCPGSGSPIDIDNDDNGEETANGVETVQFELLSSCDPADPPFVEYIDFCFEFDCSAINPLAERTCELSAVDPICNLQQLTGFCSRMYPDNSPGSQPGQLCPGGGAPHNISWFSFIALEGTYDLIIEPFACVPGPGQTENGIQIGVYPNCDFNPNEAVFCDADCNTNDVIVPSTNLEPGQVYFIFLDGCFGSICSYNISLQGTFNEPTFSADDLCIGPDAGNLDCTDPIICIDTDLNFILDGLDLEIEYTWSITTIIGDNLPGDQNPMTTLPELLLNFPTVGTYEVCVDNAFNGCKNWENNTTTGPLCRTVTVIDRGAELFEPPFAACSNVDLQTVVDLSVFDGLDPNMDGIFGWQAGVQTWAFDENTFTAEENGCFYDNTFFITELPVPPTAAITEYICESDLEPGFEYNGVTYTMANFPAGDNTLFVPDQLSLTPTSDGCDSTFNLTLELLRMSGGYEAPECIEAGVLISFIPDAHPSEWDVTYAWIGPAGPVDVTIPDQFTEIANQGDGIYTIVATISIMLPDGSTLECMSEVGPGVVVNTSSLAPDIPALVTGAVTDVCEGVAYNYTATSTTPGVTFQWDATSGNITVTGANNENATITWTDVGTPNINIAVNNACGSNFINIPINVTPPPTAMISTISPVCIDSISTITFVGDNSTVATYVWTYDGGTVSNGSGQDGGPHEVSWPTAGTKYITMMYTDMAGCVSTTALDSVIVEAPIDPPTVACDDDAANPGEVVFIWNDISGASYSFDITNPASDYTGTNLVDTTLTVTGVPDGTTITMTLITETGLACNIITSTGVCTAQDCTPADVTVIPMMDTLCENSSMLMQTVTLNIDPPQDPANPGTIMFSGPGVDPVTGVFDASVAMVGTHQISVIYTDGTGCVANGDTTITVLPAPVANFSVSNDTICSNQTTMFTYIGTGSAGIYTWNFDGGTITNSTGGVGIGPHEVMWTTGGTKTVSVVLEDANGCTSALYSDDVQVDQLIEVPTPVCAPQLADVGEVVFTWPNDPSVTYTLEILTDPSEYTDSILVDTMLTVTGVAMGTSISLVLTTDTGNSCGLLVSTPVECVPGECTDPVLTISVVSTEVCEGDMPTQQQISVTNIVPAPGAGALVDTVYSGPGVDPVTGIFDAAIAGPGMHTVTVTYTDQNNCEGMMSTDINVKPKPVASFSVSADDICISDGITFTYDGTGTPADDTGYLWNFGDAVMPIAGGANPTVEWTSPGVKTVSLSVIVDGCQSDPFMMDVNVQDVLTAPIITPCTVQDDTEVGFSWTAVPGAIEYIVTILYDAVSQPDETVSGTSITINGLTPNTVVTIIVTPVLGPGVLCPGIASASSECRALDCPDFTFDISNSDTLVCLNGSEMPIPLMFTVINDDTGMAVVGTATYTGVGAVQADGTFDPTGLTPGLYPIQISVMETATGCLASDLITFTVLEQPVSTFTLDKDNVCQDSVILVEFTGSGLGNNMPNWVVSGGSTITPTATPNFYEWTFTSAGIYTIDLLVENNICNDQAIQQTVTIDEPEMITGVTCQSGGMGEISITWDALACATEYIVYIDGVETATVTTTDYLATGLSEGLHDIEIRATSSCACPILPGTNSGDCEALGCPLQTVALTAPVTEWCQDADDLMPVTIDFTFTGTDGTLATPTWTGGDGNGGFNPAGLTAGEYIVSFSYQEPDCELVEDSITFTIFGLPSANPMPDVPSCYLDTEGFVSFSPDGGVGPYTILLDGLPADIDGVVTVVGDHNVEITDANGCMSSVMFTLNAPDPLAFETQDVQGDKEIILNTAGSYSIDPSLVGGVDLDSISWVGADGTIYCSGPDCFSMSEQFSSDDEITVTIFYNGFCSVEVMFTVVTQMVTIIDVANIISPNGDTSNEGFVIYTNDGDIVFNNVHIFDRWGNLMHLEPGWQGQGSHTVWDGKFNNTAVSPGVYVYTMEYVEEGRVKRRTGDITIIR